MPNRWIIITVNLFRRKICGYGEITTLFSPIIIFPPQPRSSWLILTSQLYRIPNKLLPCFGAQLKTLRCLNCFFLLQIINSLTFLGLLLMPFHQNPTFNPNILALRSILFCFWPLSICLSRFSDNVLSHLQKQTSRLLLFFLWLCSAQKKTWNNFCYKCDFLFACMPQRFATVELLKKN